MRARARARARARVSASPNPSPNLGEDAVAHLDAEVIPPVARLAEAVDGRAHRLPVRRRKNRLNKIRLNRLQVRLNRVADLPVHQ